MNQEQFDREFIGTKGVAEEVGVCVMTVHAALKNGFLPKPIRVTGYKIILWNRDEIQPVLEAWKRKRPKFN